MSSSQSLFEINKNQPKISSSAISAASSIKSDVEDDSKTISFVRDESNTVHSSKNLSNACSDLGDSQLKLFDKSSQDLLSEEAKHIGNLILRGEEIHIENALALIRNKPVLLHCETIATDPLGRRVKGTPLQIAAMANDMNLKAEIKEEKNRGMVERLITAGNLSKEAVSKQLQCVIGEEAQQKNQARNERILRAIIKFGTGIRDMKVEKNMSFKAFQTRCNPLITQLEKDLEVDTKEVRTCGYILDPKVLKLVTQWFKENVHTHFGEWWSIQSDVFWIGIGKLQSKLSSRDAQVVRAGVSYFVEKSIIPSRTLNNPGQHSDFFNPSSKLGIDFYLDEYGRATANTNISNGITMALQRESFCRNWKNYIKQKEQHCKILQNPKDEFQLKCCVVI